MSRYFCPFCSSSNQFHKTRGDGVLICGQCGDPLQKNSLVNPKRFFGILVASAFITPLLIMITFVINDFSKKKLPSNSESLVLLSISK